MTVLTRAPGADDSWCGMWDGGDLICDLSPRHSYPGASHPHRAHSPNGDVVWFGVNGSITIPSRDESACAGELVHYFGPPGTTAAGWFDLHGHPPGCPAYRDPDAKAVDGVATLIATSTFSIGGPVVDVDEQQSVDWHAGFAAGVRATEARLVQQANRDALTAEAAAPPITRTCTCHAAPGQGHLLRCARWQ